MPLVSGLWSHLVRKAAGLGKIGAWRSSAVWEGVADSRRRVTSAKIRQSHAKPCPVDAEPQSGLGTSSLLNVHIREKSFSVRQIHGLCVEERQLSWRVRPCMIAGMPGRHSGERPECANLAATTFLVRAVAPVLLMAGLLFRFGVLCPDDVSGETPTTVGVHAEAAYSSHEHTGHGDDHDCHHQPYHVRFVALTASALLLVVAALPLLSYGSRRQGRMVAFAIRSVPRAPPDRHIVFCVQLI